MNRGATSLTVTDDPDTGTEDLCRLSGTMTIDVIEGKHFYPSSTRLGCRSHSPPKSDLIAPASCSHRCLRCSRRSEGARESQSARAHWSEREVGLPAAQMKPRDGNADARADHRGDRDVGRVEAIAQKRVGAITRSAA